MQTQLLSVLRAQVKPAFGCTEPVACALAVARAREALGNIDSVDSIQVVCSPPACTRTAWALASPGTGERGIPHCRCLRCPHRPLGTGGAGSALCRDARSRAPGQGAGGAG